MSFVQSPASASLPAAEGGGERSVVVSWGSSLWFWDFAALVPRTMNLGVSVAKVIDRCTRLLTSLVLQGLDRAFFFKLGFSEYPQKQRAERS